MRVDAAAKPVEFVLYSRYACHLCEDMQQLLQEFSEEMDYSIKVVDIDDDPELKLAFNDAVPLLWSPKGEVCRHFLDTVALKQAVNAERNPS